MRRRIGGNRGYAKQNCFSQTDYQPIYPIVNDDLTLKIIIRFTESFSGSYKSFYGDASPASVISFAKASPPVVISFFSQHDMVKLLRNCENILEHAVKLNPFFSDQ